MMYSHLFAMRSSGRLILRYGSLAKSASVLLGGAAMVAGCGLVSTSHTVRGNSESHSVSSLANITPVSNGSSKSFTSEVAVSSSIPSTTTTLQSALNSSTTAVVATSVVLVDGFGWSLSNGIGGNLPSNCLTVGGDVPFGLPDPICTPGAIDVEISQGNLSSTICSYGFTESMRPPVSISEPVKYELMRSYGYGGLELHNYELDHLVPLELGGASTFQNLWPELNNYPAPGYFNSKDEVENELHSAVCDGSVSLQAAQDAIASDWVTALSNLGLS